jgi:hypothetical protein
MMWCWFQLVAWIRGKFYRWPSMPEIPEGYSGVSCALRSWRESREMYALGWIPWSIQTASNGLPARSFIVKDKCPAPPWFQGSAPEDCEE